MKYLSSKMSCFFFRIVFITLALIISQSISSKELNIEKVAVPPMIDGSDADWSGNWINLDQQTEASTTTDMKAKFQLTYDDYYLYCIVSVNDYSPNNNENIDTYFRDCVFFYISLKGSNDDGLYREGDWQIRKQRSPEEGGVDGYYALSNGSLIYGLDSLLIKNNFYTITKESGSNYMVEASIPWTTLKKECPDFNNFNNFLFDVSVSDNTDYSHSTQLVFWNNNSNRQYEDTRTFGTIILSDTVKTGIDPTQSLLLNRNGSYTINGITSFYDAGGLYGNYFDNDYYNLTVYPENSKDKVKVNFTSFNTESCCDYLNIYDGVNESAPLLGTYRGNVLPPTLNASNPSGALTFVFHSDGSVINSGFAAILNSTDINIFPSVAELASFDTLKTISIQADNYNWKLTENCIWFSIDSTEGKGSKEIKIAAQKNTLSIQRESFIDILFTDTSSKIQTYRLPVIQNAPDYELSLSTDYINIPWNSDSTYYFRVNSNTYWNLFGFSYYDWFTVSYQNNNADQIIEVKASKNPLITPRSKDLIFSWYDKSYNRHEKRISIYQSGALIGIDNADLITNAEDKSKLDLRIYSDSISWKLLPDNDWIHLSADTACIDSTINIEVDKNPFAYERESSLMLIYFLDNKYDTINIKLKQRPSPPWIEIDDSVNVFWKDGKYSLKVRSNAYWYHYGYNSNGILNDIRNVGDSILQITTNYNPYIFEREDALELYTYGTSQNIEKTVHIKQDAAEVGVSTNQIMLNCNEGSTADFNVKSNSVGWYLTCSADWLNIDHLSSSNDKNINIVASENKLSRERTATIYFRALNDQIYTSIQVTQKGAPIYFNLSKSRIELSDSKLSDTLTIKTNADWYVYSNNGVSCSYSGNSEGDKTISITTLNYFLNSGTLTIQYYSGNYWVYKTIYVYKNMIYTPPSSYLSIPKVKKSFVIDGIESNAEEWASIPAVPLNKKLGNTDNFSANFKMCYDDNNIYLLVNVHDITLNEIGPSSWQSDCVELYLSMDTIVRSNYSYEDWQFRKLVAPSQENNGLEIMNNGNYILSWDLVMQTTHANSYTQEWQIPINSLDYSGNFNGDYIKFDIMATDNNGAGIGRTGQLFWNSNVDDHYLNNINHGFVKFDSLTNLQVISKSEYNFAYNSEITDTVSIYVNDSLQFFCIESWIHYNFVENSRNNYLTIAVDKNPNKEARTGKIDIKGFDTERSITINQNGDTSAVRDTFPALVNLSNILTISKATKAINIDGKGNDEDWGRILSNQLTLHKGEKENIYADFKMCHDDTFIYVLVNVIDGTPHKNGIAICEHDGVELFFAMDTTVRENYSQGDWLFRKISKPLDNGGVFILNSGKVIEMLNSRFEVLQSDSGDHYTQEWRIPIYYLAKSSSFDNKNFRFDIMVSNVDENNKGRTGMLFWNSNDSNQYYSNTGYGKILMNLNSNIPIISEDSLLFNFSDTTHFKIDVNYHENFKISAEQEWIHVNYTTKSPKNYFTVSVDSSHLKEERTGMVKIIGVRFNSSLFIRQKADTIKSVPDTIIVDPLIPDTAINDTIEIETPIKDTTIITTTVFEEITQKISIYPNPASDILYINSENSIPESVIVYNILGKKVLNMKLMNKNSILDISMIKSGFYVIKVQFNNGILLEKSIIKK